MGNTNFPIAVVTIVAGVGHSDLCDRPRSLRIGKSSNWQEVGEVDAVDAGRIPRTLEIHLLGDLVDDVTPGEVVTITGIVKVGILH